MTYMLKIYHHTLKNFADDTNINLSIHDKHTKKILYCKLSFQILACLKIT